jgi:hypothetical protein
MEILAARRCGKTGEYQAINIDKKQLRFFCSSGTGGMTRTKKKEVFPFPLNRSFGTTAHPGPT